MRIVSYLRPEMRPEMPSEVNLGHPKWPINLKFSRNAIQSDFQTPKWPPKKKNFYRSEMARIVIESEFRKSKMADRSEMARNSIDSEFRTSKMVAGSHFVKNFQTKLKLHINLKWPEMRLKVNFGHPKWLTSAILSKIKKKIQVAYRSEMVRNVKFGHPKCISM